MQNEKEDVGIVGAALCGCPLLCPVNRRGAIYRAQPVPRSTIPLLTVAVRSGVPAYQPK